LSLAQQVGSAAATELQPATRATGRPLALLLALAGTGGLLAAFALRLRLLDRFPLRDDEALYSTWALLARTDPFFLQTFPDKPPLFLWMQAIALWLFGATPPAARLLSIGASLLAVALVAPTARRLWPQAGVQAGAGLVALWLLALSPFAISFAPTAYTDSLLVAWMVAALALALRARWLGAGLALGAAIMTKQQGILLVPLILALPLVVDGAPWGHLRAWVRALPPLLAGLALILIPLLLWDASRWATAPSPWDLGVRNYGALALAPPATWQTRAGDWGEPLWHLAASPWAWMLLLGATLAGLTAAWWAPQGRLRASGAVWLLAGWGAGFLALHLVSTVQPWDRYLLPLAPVMALLAAGPLAAGLGWLWARGAGWGSMGLLALALILGPPAARAAQGGLPVGGDHGALAGLDAAVTTVQQEIARAKAQGEPPLALYQQRLGWQLGFALAQEQAAGSVDVRWFASAAALADHAAKSPGRVRLLLEPAWAPTRDLALHLRTRGLASVLLAQEGHVRVYRLTPLEEATQGCTWCVNRTAARLPSGWRHVSPPGGDPVQSPLEGRP
jgi:4-amino-4-deoxy-L-arabinose transferase-like glycosyltransferase